MGGRDGVPGGRLLIAYRLDRSFAWNATHPPRLPARPRRLPRAASRRLFERRIESPVGIAAGPLANSKWLLAYARLGYGILTYRTVRTVARPALAPPNLVFCLPGDPAVVESRPRRLDPSAVTWAVSFGMPSPEPEEWRSDVARARKHLDSSKLLVVSVMGTPVPGGDGEQLALDYARCAHWAVEAGADVVELCLSAPATSAEHPQMVFENPTLASHVAERVRRTVGGHPVIAKLGAAPTPRALHDLATRLARWVEGFVLVDGLQRRLVRDDGTPALPAPGRELVRVSGGGVYDQCRIQIDELLAWRKAGAWDRVVFAVGGLTSVERIGAALAAGADAAMVATAALSEPLIAARFRLAR